MAVPMRDSTIGDKSCWGWNQYSFKHGSGHSFNLEQYCFITRLSSYTSKCALGGNNNELASTDFSPRQLLFYPDQTAVDGHTLSSPGTKMRRVVNEGNILVKGKGQVAYHRDCPYQSLTLHLHLTRPFLTDPSACVLACLIVFPHQSVQWVARCSRPRDVGALCLVMCSSSHLWLARASPLCSAPWSMESSYSLLDVWSSWECSHTSCFLRALEFPSKALMPSSKRIISGAPCTQKWNRCTLLTWVPRLKFQKKQLWLVA